MWARHAPAAAWRWPLLNEHAWAALIRAKPAVATRNGAGPITSDPCKPAQTPRSLRSRGSAPPPVPTAPQSTGRCGGRRCVGDLGHDDPCLRRWRIAGPRRLRATPSYCAPASTIGIGPGASPLVEDMVDVFAAEIHCRPAADSFQPCVHAQPSGKVRGHASQQLWHADPGRPRSALQRCVNPVVDVSDLHRLRHIRIMSCASGYRAL